MRINEDMYYLRRDHQGSVTALVDKGGKIAEEYSYDAWGRRRTADTWEYFTEPQTTLLSRGYTFHEHLDEFDLINMNGRAYDPVVGRFLSADIHVQAPGNTQSYNRYSYCFNNPLKYTDPSGYTTGPGFNKIANYYRDHIGDNDYLDQVYGRGMYSSGLGGSNCVFFMFYGSEIVTTGSGGGNDNIYFKGLVTMLDDLSKLADAESETTNDPAEMKKRAQDYNNSQKAIDNDAKLNDRIINIFGSNFNKGINELTITTKTGNAGLTDNGYYYLFNLGLVSSGFTSSEPLTIHLSPAILNSIYEGLFAEVFMHELTHAWQLSTLNNPNKLFMERAAYYTSYRVLMSYGFPGLSLIYWNKAFSKITDYQKWHTSIYGGWDEDGFMQGNFPKNYTDPWINSQFNINF